MMLASHLSRVTAAVLFGFAAASPALPPPSASPPVFQERPFGPKPAPTPPRPSVVRTQTPEPLPRAWIVGGVAFGSIAGAAVLFFGIRAWRMSRLFGRQHLFPVRDQVALRLDGERSGRIDGDGVVRR